MNTRLLIFNLLLALTIASQAQIDTMDSPKYVQRVNRYRSDWESLIPTQFIIQNAGNMGLFSLGVGWDYGRKNQWETHLLFGYLPKYKSTRPKMTMTIKETFIPWRVTMKKGWEFEPLTTGLYLNTIFGHEFWASQPGRYPDKYYDISTKFRLNVFVGQRITLIVPNNRRKFIKSITLFYELSTCDLYIRSMTWDWKNEVHFRNIFGLSLGAKMQFF